MSPKLYYFAMSTPSRGVLLTARALGIPVDIEIINLLKKEQLSESFLKINPQHVVPTLDDNGFILWESRAIACYLIEKYGKDDQLYPKDIKQRAIVNQRLYFDATSIFVKIRAMCFPIIFLGETEVKQILRDDLYKTLEFLEQFLSQSKWVAGNNLTVADLFIYASMSSIIAVGMDISKLTNIQRWLTLCKSFPGSDENEEGAKMYGDAFKKNLK